MSAPGNVSPSSQTPSDPLQFGYALLLEIYKFVAGNLQVLKEILRQWWFNAGHGGTESLRNGLSDFKSGGCDYENKSGLDTTRIFSGCVAVLAMSVHAGGKAGTTVVPCPNQGAGPRVIGLGVAN